MKSVIRVKNIVRKGEIAVHNVIHTYISLARQNAGIVC